MRPPVPDTLGGLNVTLLIFVSLAVLGAMGSALAVSSWESAFKIGLFLFGATGTSGSFYGLLKFHGRRTRATGDPRTTVYSAFAIYSALFFAIVFGSIAFLVFGRDYGWVGERFSDAVSYFLITDVIGVLFMLGVVCVWDVFRPGILAHRIYLWPWSYVLASYRSTANDSEATRNDADHNPETYDRETDHNMTREERWDEADRRKDEADQQREEHGRGTDGG